MPAASGSTSTAGGEGAGGWWAGEKGGGQGEGEARFTICPRGTPQKLTYVHLCTSGAANGTLTAVRLENFASRSWGIVSRMFHRPNAPGVLAVVVGGCARRAPAASVGLASRMWI